MAAIFKRELSAYFNSAVGYVVIAAFMFFNGIFFYVYCLYAGTSDMYYVFQGMFFIVLFIIPLLTMRLLADDKKNKTDRALITAPIHTISIVLAKFLSALIIFAICLCGYITDGIILSFIAEPDWSVILGNVFGMLIMGAAFISIGIFISSLTENLLIAAIFSFVINVLIVLIDTVSSTVSSDALNTVLDALSFQAKYTNFSLGLISLSDVVFFITFTAFFIFLTQRVLDRRRWA